ncbi:MAG: phosphate signaling complex protein PhoU [Acidobacteria bacterium]|nr:phosphate signaling complex protein PhoU [Acidobacteriota bacterium]
MKHFEEELEELKNRLLEMAGLVESAVYRSVAAVVEKDPDQAQQVLKNEARINQMEIENDELTTRLLATQQPMAVDMRFLTAALKINSDLERMGDLAVTIVERALSLMREPVIRPEIDIPQLAKLSESMIRKSLDAFVRRDPEMARSVLLADDAVDSLRDAIYEQLIEFMKQEPENVRPGVNLMFVARNLERLADHATNIAEVVLFLVQGVDVRHHAEVRE